MWTERGWGGGGGGGWGRLLVTCKETRARVCKFSVECVFLNKYIINVIIIISTLLHTESKPELNTDECTRCIESERGAGERQQIIIKARLWSGTIFAMSTIHIQRNKEREIREWGDDFGAKITMKQMVKAHSLFVFIFYVGSTYAD